MTQLPPPHLSCRLIQLGLCTGLLTSPCFHSCLLIFSPWTNQGGPLKVEVGSCHFLPKTLWWVPVCLEYSTDTSRWPVSPPGSSPRFPCGPHVLLPTHSLPLAVPVCPFSSIRWVLAVCPPDVHTYTDPSPFPWRMSSPQRLS